MKIGLLAALALAVAGCSGSVAVSEDLAEAVANAEPGSVIRVAPGNHPGPILIDKALTLIGGEEVVVTVTDSEDGVVVANTRNVTIRGIRIDGGANGIVVRKSEAVEIDGVHVIGSIWHGIHVQDSEVNIRGCTIDSLRGPMAQGIEIINSDGRPPSSVSGCVVVGPVHEGVAAHVSRVTFTDNMVTGATARGVVITEMSRGVMENNQVADSQGSAYFCGDMSTCSIVGNTAVGIGDGDGRVSQRGHGVVVHFYSNAYVGALDVTGLAGQDILPMLGGHLLSEPPSYP